MKSWNWRWAVITILALVLWYVYCIFLLGKGFPWYSSVIVGSILLGVFVVFIGLVNVVIAWAIEVASEPE